jgi:hypothetical protein
MNNNLTPTRIVDKNNKVTTVHKRNGVQPPGAGKLGSLKPTIKKAPKTAVSKVTFSLTKSGPKMITLDPGFFIARAGLAERAERLLSTMGDEGSVEIDDEVLYEYLLLGIKPPVAAVLHLLSNGDLDGLKADPDFVAALPGDLGTTNHWGGGKTTDNDIVRVVDFLSEAGIKPAKISAVLSNNLNDERMKDNVLTPEQLTELFTSHTYSVSKNEDKGTSASRFMDAVLNGRLPYEFGKKGSGIERYVASLASDVLYPKSRQVRAFLSDAQRSKLLDDPELLINSAKVISRHRLMRGAAYATAEEAIELFGMEASMENHPEEMLKKRFDGKLVGPEGARAMKEVKELINAEVIGAGRGMHYLNPEGDHLNLMSNGVPDVEIWTEDIAEIASHGYSPEQIADSILNKRLNSRQILAVLSGKTIATVAEGWL